MNPLQTSATKYPLTVFVIVTFALSWWTIPFAAGGIFPYGPFFAAVIILTLNQGMSLSKFFRQMISWPSRWYLILIGPGLVLTYLFLALILNRNLGATISHTAHLNSFAPTLLGTLLLGGMWEEPGWTGYALPLLQDRYANHPHGLLGASLHMGVIRAAWHLPLMVSGAIPWYDVVFFSMALQFLITWLFNRSGGSVLAVMLLHLTSNVVGGGIMLPLFTGSDHDRYYKLFIAIAWLLALLLVGSNRWSMGQPKNTR